MRMPVPRLSPASKATDAATMVGASRCSRSLRTWGQALSTEIRHQRLRYSYRSVSRLVVLQERNDGAGERDTRGVQGMHEIWLGLGSGPVPDIRAAGLKI